MIRVTNATSARKFSSSRDGAVLCCPYGSPDRRCCPSHDCRRRHAGAGLRCRLTARRAYVAGSAPLRARDAPPNPAAEYSNSKRSARDYEIKLTQTWLRSSSRASASLSERLLAFTQPHPHFERLGFILKPDESMNRGAWCDDKERRPPANAWRTGTEAPAPMVVRAYRGAGGLEPHCALCATARRSRCHSVHDVLGASARRQRFSGRHQRRSN